MTGTAPLLIEASSAFGVNVEVVKKYPCSNSPWMAPRNLSTSGRPTLLCQRLHWIDRLTPCGSAIVPPPSREPELRGASPREFARAGSGLKMASARRLYDDG